jgi:hypothetical protein
VTRAGRRDVSIRKELADELEQRFSAMARGDDGRSRGSLAQKVEFAIKFTLRRLPAEQSTLATFLAAYGEGEWNAEAPMDPPEGR